MHDRRAACCTGRASPRTAGTGSRFVGRHREICSGVGAGPRSPQGVSSGRCSGRFMMMRFRKAEVLVTLAILAAVALQAQEAGVSSDVPYVLGPDDTLTVHVADMEEIGAAPVVVDM